MKFVEGEDNDFLRFDEVGDAAWNGMIPSNPFPLFTVFLSDFTIRWRWLRESRPSTAV